MMLSQFFGAKNLLLTAEKIVILSHKNPDGDTIGANLAMRLALKQQWGKEVISACVDPPPLSCHFLTDFSEYKTDFSLEHTDLIVTVDCGSSVMVKFHETKPTLFAGMPPIINIDHHATNDSFGFINIIDPSAAAACQIVYHFLKYCGFRIDRHIATCLLHGLYYDTGSFMHSNTTPEVLEIASDLVWKGADFKTIVRQQFHMMTIPQLKIYGRILERLRINDKKILTAVLSKQDFSAAGADQDDTTGAIDYLNSVPDGNFCCLLYEDRKGLLKGSFRTRVEHIDLSRLAGFFNGGGHKKAAGFSLPGKLLEMSPRIRIGKNG